MGAFAILTVVSQIFIVPGYGLPDDILTDETYKKYLTGVFKHISAYAGANPHEQINLVFCGGNSDTTPPYLRTEAGEMVKLFGRIAEAGDIKKVNWNILLEDKSYSTLENIINTKALLEKQAIIGIYSIFCEETRVERMRWTAEKVLRSEVDVIPVHLRDYSDEERVLMKKKEKASMPFLQKALESESNYEAYVERMRSKFEYLRGFPSEKQDEALKAWWAEIVKREGIG